EEQRVAALGVGGAERLAVAPHVQLARQALDHVDAGEPSLGVIVVSRRDVNPERSNVGVAERVAAQDLALDLELVDPPGEHAAPRLHGRLLRVGCGGNGTPLSWPDMPEVSGVVGIGLAGGQGMRARPLTLKAPGYLRSKAAMSFLGRRLIRWVMTILSSEGIKDYYVIAHGKENRYQIKVMIGYGEGFGVDVKYSPVKYDALSTGSADSALRLMEYWDISQTALVFPTDTIIDFDLAPMLEAHRRTGAIATIAAMVREPDEVAEKYGVLVADDEERVDVFG